MQSVTGGGHQRLELVVFNPPSVSECRNAARRTQNVTDLRRPQVQWNQGCADPHRAEPHENAFEFNFIYKASAPWPDPEEAPKGAKTAL